MKRYASSAAAQSGWKRAGRVALLPSESERESLSSRAFPVTKMPFMSGWDRKHHQYLPIESCQPSWSALRKSRSKMLRRRR